MVYLVSFVIITHEDSFLGIYVRFIAITPIFYEINILLQFLNFIIIFVLPASFKSSALALNGYLCTYIINKNVEQYWPVAVWRHHGPSTLEKLQSVSSVLTTVMI